VHSIVSAGCSAVCGQATGPSWSSTTATSVSTVLPPLVTSKVHVTGSPAKMSGPGGSSASSPSVDLRTRIAGSVPKWFDGSLARTTPPVGGTPVTVAQLVYSPAAAIPVAVHSSASPAARTVLGHDTGPMRSSTTSMSVSSLLPVLVTTYVHVTSSPTGMSGPGGSLASSSLVALTMSMAAATPKWCEGSEASTVRPDGAVPTTVPMLAYWPAAALPPAQHTRLRPGGSWNRRGQAGRTPWSSLTANCSGTLPVLLNR